MEEIKKSTLRQQKILSYLQETGEATIEQLCDVLQVSSASIRRDLESLEMSGSLRRVRGGATLSTVLTFNPLPGGPITEMIDKIGKAAVEYVRDGAIVYLGPGSTTLFVAKYLSSIPNLTILVSHPKHAAILQNALAREVWVLGGKLDQQVGCILGNFAEQMLRRIHPDIAILSCEAVCASKGLIYSTAELASLMKIATEQAHQTIAIADRTKFNRNTSGPFLPFDRLNLLITNRGIDSETIKKVQDSGLALQEV
jgi:DeoR/GlpR family transcriptional regulator of sugar metabolism